MPTSTPSTPRLELLKVGSDPEALFVKAQDSSHIPATRFVGGQHALSAWIGTDGNSSTAELRPRPARDVWLHARNIAEALVTINQVVCQKHADIFLVAQPCHNGLPCGGHIHLSFMLHDPLAVPMLLRGWTWNAAGTNWRMVVAGSASRSHARNEYAADGQILKNRYAEAVRQGTAFGFNHLVRRLGAVIQPLDLELHPRERRIARQYGENEDAIRSEHAALLVAPGVARWRVEYRYPSTWLAHPALALSYLGLAKLVLNNYHVWPPSPYVPLPELPAFLEQGVLRQIGAVVTEDVRHLPKLLRFVITEVRPRLQEPLVRVDFDAWARFLNEGRWK